MSDPLLLHQYEKVAGAELKQLRQRFMVLMQQDDDPDRFPGAQPVSFERKHLSVPEAGHSHPSLVAAPYYAAEKTDGVRWMLMILGTRGAFAVDRNFDVRRLPPMRFPSRLNPAAALDATLLDGELVMDMVSSGGKRPQPGADTPAPPATPRMRFLAYDACHVAGKPCCDEPINVRLMRLRREVLGPRYALSVEDPATMADEPFTVEQKDFFSVRQLPHIFSRVQTAAPGSNMLYAFTDPLRALSHGNDGIIFTPMKDPYRPYTCPALLKWKPANMNSIDFKLMTKWRREGDKKTAQPRFVLCCSSNGMPEPYGWITFSDEDFARFSEDPKKDSRILECVYDPNWQTVEYNPDDMRERTWSAISGSKSDWPRARPAVTQLMASRLPCTIHVF